ncbi:MAG: glutamate--tRNA ligase [Anaerolineales bacterium]|nr:glutamate--tRNA ligase [Anaerolineales bacterium]
MKPARVRFAPSPTGRLHIGGARTALYNVLLAKQTGGQFILRIEDTDTKRTVAGALEELQAGLRWLGLDWQEGPDIGGPHAPYTQQARKALYQRYAEELLARGHAYRCFCTAERLQQVREAQQKAKQSPRYDGTCRALSPVEAERRAAAGEPFTIRFKLPKDGATTAHDHVRGDITVDNTTLDDFILVKSDGLALYHLAAMVDDHEMGISHVLRGTEWLGTFPLHVLIIRAFGWEEPVWCHLSVFLKPSGKGKMSKRDVTSEQSIYVAELEELGYLSEAVNSWMALMGASFGAEEELLSLDEMAARFDLGNLNPSAARVNFEKLDDFNGKWIRRLAVDDLAGRVRPFFEKAGLHPDPDTLRRVTPLFQPRIVTLDDAVEMAGFFFRPAVSPRPEDLLIKGQTPEQSRAALQAARTGLAAVPEWQHAALEAPMRALAESLGLKAGQFFGVLRAAVTGQSVSPPLFECMEVVGRETTLARLAQAEALVGPA